MTTIKKALIRKPGYPIGKPAPMFINCCGNQLDCDHAFQHDAAPVTCPTCNVQYQQNGYVVPKTINAGDIVLYRGRFATEPSCAGVVECFKDSALADLDYIGVRLENGNFYWARADQLTLA